MSGHYTHELTTAVTACPCPAKDLASKHSNKERREGLKRPCPLGEEVLAVGGYWGKGSVFSSGPWPLVGGRCSTPMQVCPMTGTS